MKAAIFIAAFLHFACAEEISKGHEIPKDMCKFLLDEFSEAVSNYTKCSTKFARPIQLCLRCRNEYMTVIQDYDVMQAYKQDNLTCKDVLTKQDRLNIIEQIYNFNVGEKSLWETASCPNCYLHNNASLSPSKVSNDFFILWNMTLTCFSNYTDINGLFDLKGAKRDKGNLCEDCADIYNALREFFWTDVIYSTKVRALKGVCYDLRDAFNYTGIIWKNEFNCDPKTVNWGTMLAVTLPAIFCMLLTYFCEPFFLPRVFGWKTKTKVHYVLRDPQDWKPEELPAATTDSNDPNDANFYVVSGIKCDDYVKRFATKTYQTEDNEEFDIRLPPVPDKLACMEYNNDEWTVPPDEAYEKMAQIIQKFKDGEIDQRQADIQMCRVVVDDLRKNQLNDVGNHKDDNVGEMVADTFDMSDDIQLLSDATI